MTKRILYCVIAFTCICQSVEAQTREELERQRLELRKEIQQTEKLLSANKEQTSKNLLQWRLITNKVDLQNKIVTNLNKDVTVLNNNAYTIQKDINKYDRLLDTLKKEYAKSMVYAYKNRSNYDFLNFIFSADNFNDAIKRVAYLKSYRSYREAQGENILKTQDLRKRKVGQLQGAKESKTITLRTQSQEKDVLAAQQAEQDKVLAELKKQGGQLTGQISAKQKQLKKVDNVIAAAIKKAIADARKEALAKAAEEARLRKIEEQRLAKIAASEDAARKKEDDARIAAAKKAAEATANTNTSIPAATAPIVEPKKEVVKAVVEPKKEMPAAPKRSSELLNEDNISLNANFERNRGSLPWPVDNGYPLMHYGLNRLPGTPDLQLACVTIASNIGTPVKSIFDGEVLVAQSVDELMGMVVIQHGKYFTTYSNITGIKVKVGDNVRTGQQLGSVAGNLDGIGAVDFYMSNEKSNFDPETWLRKK